MRRRSPVLRETLRVTTLLWDIDGTLMRSPGVGVKSFWRAIETVTGIRPPKQRYDFGGKTDPLIAEELLHAVGIDNDELVPQILLAVDGGYRDLHAELVASAVVLPGVAVLLASLAERGVGQTVVTGNIEPVARRKLAVVGLDRHLDLDAGGYGSDHPDRAQLVRQAIERMSRVHGDDPDRIWVIGDTPRDAACAEAVGIRCILVATGTFDSIRLSLCGADAVLENLEDTTAVLSIIES